MPLGFIEYADDLKIKDYGNYVIGDNGAVVMNLTTRKKMNILTKSKFRLCKRLLQFY
ncbi:hypothetical protein P344_00635 [Spiroplasma mirum ATCC 29335]|uniref:Uncharacterized protein n=2 Tax=Spiroplasma mirum TaxID=2144 RepID=W6ALC7_9MOLU|nr:hypothetical protein P344_00635 [Spiroplasma mirum ATCC 29335]